MAHEATLHRAVGLNEVRDIEEHGGFRVNSRVGYEGGKWFAAQFDDAVRWGRALQRFPAPRPFRIVAIRVPRDLPSDIEFHPRWNAIGPAFYVRANQLPAFNRAGVITVFATVYEVEEAP